MEMRNIVGEKFNRWLVLEYSNARRDGDHYWLCVCDCGIKKQVRGYSLTSNTSKSCGCFKLEKATTHGLSSSKEFDIWASMIDRCINKNNKKYQLYGGKGITVCDRWQKFENFYSDMGLRPTNKHSIDRINSNGNYEPLNCRWATYKEQNNNKSTNTKLIHNGIELNLNEWAKITGLHRATISSRLIRGYSVELALTKIADGKHIRKRRRTKSLSANLA